MDDESIRSKAEHLLRQKHPVEKAAWQNNLPAVVEELQIHQIELELQNEELRQKQEELQTAQKKYLNLYNFAPVGYITFDPNGLILELNLTAARLLGSPRQQLTGRTITPYLTQESIVEFYQHCHITLGRADAAAPTTCELSLAAAGDPPAMVALESVSVLNEAGIPYQIRSAMIDITQQKLIEQRLRVSEANWAALVNNTGDLIWAIDRNHTIIRANQALRTVIKTAMGYRLEAGSDVFRIFPPELDGAWRSHLGQAFYGKNIVAEMDMWGETYEVSINPFKAEEGVVAGVVVYAHNISEHKAMEKILRNRNRQLDSFAHKIAHDLNAPLSMLTGYADYLLKHAAGVDVEELLRLGNKIDDAARQAAKILDELLFLADSSRENFVPTPLNVLEILQQVCERLTTVINQTTAEINLPQSLPFAMGYAPWVEKVSLNLLSIALSAAPQPRTLLIGGEKNGPEGTVRFWIRTQPGAAWRPDRITAAHHGVELAVIERVMQRMHGGVGIEPLPDHSLELYFTLPATQFSGVTPH